VDERATRRRSAGTGSLRAALRAVSPGGAPPVKVGFGASNKSKASPPPADRVLGSLSAGAFRPRDRTPEPVCPQASILIAVARASGRRQAGPGERSFWNPGGASRSGVWTEASTRRHTMKALIVRPSENRLPRTTRYPAPERRDRPASDRPQSSFPRRRTAGALKIDARNMPQAGSRRPAGFKGASALGRLGRDLDPGLSSSCRRLSLIS